MENATKALVIAASVLVVIVVIAAGVLLLNSGANSGEQAEQVGNEISLATKNSIDKIQTELDYLNNGKEVKISSINLNRVNIYEEYYGFEIYEKINVTILPENATNKEIEWSSSNTNVATVSDGNITIKDVGIAEITAKATDGSGKTATCYVEVYYPVCFVPGTQVLTENGFVKIEDIQVGDYVYALNLDNNQKELKQIKKAITSKSKKIYKLKIGDEIVEATPRHEFYIVDKGWIRAYDLEVGDTLVSKEQDLIISNIEEVIYEEPITVYNLEVEGHHNYLVTKYEVLVHNAGSPT